MSAPRCVRRSGVAEAGRPARPPGDTTRPSNTHHKSNNKIPKNIRYDLENALLGLCDVWFEEIKPYLVHNNIKLHIHEAGGDAASYPQMPLGAPGCSHLDPGAASDHRVQTSANCAGSSATQRTASKARCRRPVPQCASPLTVQHQSHPSPSNVKIEEQCHAHQIRPRIWSRRPHQQQFMTSTAPVPHSTHPPTKTFHSPPSHRHKYTKTQVENPESRRKPLTSPAKISRLEKVKREPKPAVSPSPRKPTSPEELLAHLHLTRDKRDDIPENKRTRRSRKEANTEHLFSQDLIDAICESHATLQVLYQNTERKEYPSIMQLVMPKKKLKIKQKPWR